MKRITALLLSILLILTLGACGSQNKTEPTATARTYRQITMDIAKQIIETETGYILLDVRTREEFAEGHIKGAICIPNEEIETADLKELPDKEQLILVYCRSGRRSKEASQKLADRGYLNVAEFGGIIDWPGEVVKD
ncbi:rhodanese-like domain-containing protein [uncultured Ruminococcus sp.]|uniref:rhodanese-like domain-containing protein n=1 Tax=uncultured Ruminococcus sp. TaxID=165186 RepID=UPI0029301B8C|nr:rhodanese-like domain-containing protein [uncultured Ruminococcus sp.]